VYREPSIWEAQLRQMRLALRYAGVTSAERALVSDSDRDALRAAAAVLGVHVETTEDAQSVTPGLDRLEAAIERVEQLAASLAAFEGRFPGTGGEFAQDSVLKRIVAHLVSPWQRAVLRVDDRLVARVTLDNIVVELRATADEGDGIERIELETVTHVPITLGPVGVRPQRFRDEVASAFGMRKEHELGIAAFDDAYWLTGTPDATRALVTEDVARAMVQLGRLAPTLSIEGGSARLRWALDSSTAIVALILESFGTGGRAQADALVPPAVFSIHNDLRRALTVTTR
jgi:hypothetical protein